RPDAGRQQRQMQGAGARVHGDALIRADIVRELGLERRDLVAKDELTRLEDLVDGGLDVGFDRRVLRLEVEKRNHSAHPTVSSSTMRPRAAIDCEAASRMRTTRRPAWPSVIVGWP